MPAVRAHAPDCQVPPEWRNTPDFQKTRRDPDHREPATLTSIADDNSFRHGVASGDPLPDGVLLWTRWTPPAAVRPESVDVGWQVALDAGFDDVVAKGTAATGPDDDYTVKVDVGDLDPATTYWYRFQGPGADGALSPVGRTRTAPAFGAPVADMRLGLVSCASLPAGRFHAYRNLAGRDVDLVVHVGDYIYENDRHARTVVRLHQPRPAAVSLAHYRARHAQYKADPHLRALHARHPIVAVWDDHEFAGGSWRDGAAHHDDTQDGPWSERKAAAIRAYREWMPVRWPGDGDRVYRSLHWGDLVDLAMLDTRLVGRDRPGAGGVGWSSASATGAGHCSAGPAEVVGGRAGGVDRPVAGDRQPGGGCADRPGGGAAGQPGPVGRLPRRA